MGRLDMDYFNYTSKDEMRLLTAIEMGMKNHDIVPLQLIKAISGMKKLSNSGINKLLHEMSNKRLVRREVGGGDAGFKLLVSGYDFLALKALVKQNHLSALGNQIGVGKESDVYVGLAGDKEICVKLHRLGRTSFRQIKNKRDYLRHRHHASWLYLSRLSAETEATLMQALHTAGFPVPAPVAQNRHVVLMELVPCATPLYQVKELQEPEAIYEETVRIMRSILEQGLVHGDFNEFNLLISTERCEDGTEKEVLRVIDFPQMISRNHRNAKFYYNRDAACIASFFEKRFGIRPADDNGLSRIPAFDDVPRKGHLDVELHVSGFQSDPALQEDEEVEESEGDEPDEGEGSDESEEEDEEEEEEEDEEEEEEEEKEEKMEEEEEEEAEGKKAAAASGIKPRIGGRRRTRRMMPLSANEVRARVRQEAAKKERKAGGKRMKQQARAERVSMGRRDVREELDFGGL